MKIWGNKNIVIVNDCKKFLFMFWGNFVIFDCKVLVINEYVFEIIC